MILLKIERESKLPYYMQIVNQVRELVDRDVLKDGERMPSTRVLSEKIGVHRTTVYKAYEELWALGYIESTPGSYTRVRCRSKISKRSDRPEKGIIDWGKISIPTGNILYNEFKRFRPESNGNEGKDIIDLSPLEVDHSLFPVSDFRRCVRKVMLTMAEEVLSYGKYAGFRPLREYIAKRLQIHGVDVSAEEILITNGSQNGIDLILKMLVAPGKRVFVEAPTYAIILPLLRFYQADVTGIPFKDDGIDLEYLEKELKKESGAFLYTMPNFQNPTGITTSQSHRESLLSLCEKYKLPIIEDGFEEEMKYFGKVSMPIKSMDRNHLVLYVGTFSKVLFAGARIGWIAAEKECIDRLTAIKRFSDLSSSPFLQAIMYEFCKEGYYDRHIKKMHRVYRKRMQTVLESLNRYLPREKVSWTEPSGGYLIWLKLKDCEMKPAETMKVLSKNGVMLSPGEYYFHGSNPGQCYRISISTLDEGKIEEGIRRLGNAIREIYTL